MRTVNKFAAAGLTSILIGMNSCSENPLALRASLKVDTTTEAARFYRDFPANQLPSTGAVHKYPVSDAKHCLVHLGHFHYVKAPLTMEQARKDLDTASQAFYLLLKDTPNFSYQPSGDIAEDYRNLVRHRIEGICRVQREVFDIGRFLQKNYGVQSIRGEGLAKDYSQKDCDKWLRNRNIGITREGFATEEEVKDPSRYLLIGGADLVLGVLGLKVKAGEDEDINRRTAVKVEAALKEGNLAEKKDIIFKEAEDYVLQLVSRSNEPYSVVIYGGGHNFLDNVNDWNVKNPKDKFSLIVVTPRSIDGNKKKQKVN